MKPTLPKVLVSGCLLGQPVRYDGSHKGAQHAVLDRWLAQQQVVLTVPASFDAAARELTREAAIVAAMRLVWESNNVGIKQQPSIGLNIERYRYRYKNKKKGK